MKGKLSLSDENKMRRAQYARLLNVGIELQSDLLPEVTPEEGLPPLITSNLI